MNRSREIIRRIGLKSHYPAVPDNRLGLFNIGNGATVIILTTVTDNIRVVSWPIREKFPKPTVKRSDDAR